jgi:hypothetical protein
LAGGDLNLREDALYRVVVRIQPFDFDPICGEKTNFRINDRVFASALLVSIVNH